MMIALTHFGSDEFLPLLKLWFDRYLKSGCHLNVVVLSDKKVDRKSTRLNSSHT